MTVVTSTEARTALDHSKNCYKFEFLTEHRRVLIICSGLAPSIESYQTYKRLILL